MRNSVESQTQIAYFVILALAESKYPQLKWVHASMNGASASSKAAAAQRKRQGQKAGVADIFIPVARRGYHGCWIELKIKPNKLSESQIAFLAEMKANGYDTHTAWSLADLLAITEQYLSIKLPKIV